jgi:hypothetical protein
VILMITENADGSFTIQPFGDRCAWLALFAYAEGLESAHEPTPEELDQAKRLRDYAGRAGAPPEKWGSFVVNYQQDQRRHGVLLNLFPPVRLRDATRDQIRQAVRRNGDALLREIEDTIWRSYTSDTIDASAARMAGEELIKHADSMREGTKSNVVAPIAAARAAWQPPPSCIDREICVFRGYCTNYYSECGAACR